MMGRGRNLFGISRRRRSNRLEATLVGWLLVLGAVVWIVERFWPLLLMAGVGWGVWEMRRVQQSRARLRALELADVDRMSGSQFERYLAWLLPHHGYVVEHTGRAGDQGCDLLLRRDGRRIACQAKRYRGRVTNDAVAEAVAAKAYYDCSDAMVITSSYFTSSAERLAAANECALIDRDELADLIRGVGPDLKNAEAG